MCTGKQNVGNEGSKNDSPAKFCILYIFSKLPYKKASEKIQSERYVMV
jgi:hypothetical protein